MTLKEVAGLRLINQQISAAKFKSPQELVGWMGAIQAQDYAMAKWGIGLRVANATDKIIEAAIDKGEIIRTHVLRPTWHFVAAEDLYEMLELTASRIKGTLGARHKELSITDSVLNKSNKIIVDNLSGNHHLTREEIALFLNKAKIATDNNRLSHLLLYAELEGLICSGRSQGSKKTYALLSERVDLPKNISKDAALKKLANKYFLSHGPATLQDFVWWSGLAVKEARSALEMVSGSLISEKVGEEIYWFSAHNIKTEKKSSLVHLLPAYDEFIISYKNRDASLRDIHNRKAISDNGIFRPVIVINGQAVGLWKRTLVKDVVIIETEFFRSVNKKELAQITEAAERFGNFLARRTEVKYK